MRYLAEIKSLIEFMLGSAGHHVLVLSSAPGWAKTASTRQVLGELGVEYQMLGAYSTPLALYNKLASSIEPEGVAVGRGLFILDDTAGVLSNPQALSILNAASWPTAEQGNRRRVIWTSTTEKAACPAFDFEGKLLILTNHMSEMPQAKAFVSRALTYAIEIKADDVSALFTEAAQSREHFSDPVLAQRIAQFVGEQAKAFEPGKISLRDLSRAYDLAMHFRDEQVWQQLFLKTLPQRTVTDISPEDVVADLDRSGKRVGEQVALFCGKTGLGRRKFFYLRQMLGFSSETKSRTATVVAMSKANAKESGRAVRFE